MPACCTYSTRRGDAPFAASPSRSAAHDARDDSMRATASDRVLSSSKSPTSTARRAIAAIALSPASAILRAPPARSRGWSRSRPYGQPQSLSAHLPGRRVRRGSRPNPSGPPSGSYPRPSRPAKREQACGTPPRCGTPSAPPSRARGCRPPRSTRRARRAPSLPVGRARRGASQARVARLASPLGLRRRRGRAAPAGTCRGIPRFSGATSRAPSGRGPVAASPSRRRCCSRPRGRAGCRWRCRRGRRWRPRG